jgi:hypothetical protein
MFYNSVLVRLTIFSAFVICFKRKHSPMNQEMFLGASKKGSTSFIESWCNITSCDDPWKLSIEYAVFTTQSVAYIGIF